MAITIHASKERGQWPLRVNWTFTATGATALSYLIKFAWDFGDGTTSYERNPSHVYRMPGTYTVTCRVYDDLGNAWLSTATTVTVTDWLYGTGTGIDGSVTDKCFRFALPQKPGQGIGWCVYDDVVEDQRTYGWPYPESIVGCCDILDEQQKKRHLVIDTRTFRHYEVGLDDHWIDAEDTYGGVEMESEITWRENMPPVGASAKLKHNQTHLTFKPWFKDRRNTGDYGATGYRNAFEADLYVKVASSPDRYAITKETPIGGQLVFDRHIVDEFLQPGTLVRGAPWRLVRSQQWYEQQDTAAAPPKKAMSEYDWGLEYSTPMLWVPRNIEFPMMDAASGVELGGSYAAVTTGPDGKGGSALAFVMGQELTGTIQQFGGDFTFSVWLKNAVADTFLMVLDNEPLDLLLHWNGSGYDLRLQDGVQTCTVPLLTGFTSWSQLVCSRHGGDFKVWQNGSIAGIVHMGDSTRDYGGNLALIRGIITASDIRLLPRALTDEAVLWGYKDMTEYNGNVTCPPW